MCVLMYIFIFIHLFIYVYIDYCIYLFIYLCAIFIHYCKEIQNTIGFDGSKKAPAAEKMLLCLRTCLKQHSPFESGRRRRRRGGHDGTDGRFL